jgi:hypothetical protein
VRFCTECGANLPNMTVNFCPTCGTKLWKNELENEFYQEDSQSSNTIYSLGIKLEQMFEGILKSRGFTTTRRKRLEGKSGTFHEIDILATKNEVILAVECKNYGEKRTVGLKDIRDFHSKLLDLPQINKSWFVTNIEYSSGVKNYATQYNIELWDGEKLRNDFYRYSLGRVEDNEEIIIGRSLPVKVNYDLATKISLVNPDSIFIKESNLIFYPFYLFYYEINITKGFLKKQNFHKTGNYIMDAINNLIINVKNTAEDKEFKNTFFTKGVVTNLIMNVKNTAEGNKDKIDREKIALDNIERTQIAYDIENIKPEAQLKIQKANNYVINKLESKSVIHAAERMVLETIIQENNIKHDNVKITSSELIHVPKWLIHIVSKNITYEREILASSNLVLIDEIEYCPKDYFSKFRPSQKKTFAVCEICGNAFCKSHVVEKDEKFYCEKHNFRSSYNIQINNTQKEEINHEDTQQIFERIKENMDSFINNSLKTTSDDINK